MPKDVNRKNTAMLKFPGLWDRITEALGTTSTGRIAGLLDVKASTVSQWKYGETLISVDNLLKIATISGTTIEWLLRGIGEPPKTKIDLVRMLQDKSICGIYALTDEHIKIFEDTAKDHRRSFGENVCYLIRRALVHFALVPDDSFVNLVLDGYEDLPLARQKKALEKLIKELEAVIKENENKKGKTLAPQKIQQTKAKSTSKTEGSA